ncbi:MFS general substrate transporter [Biscogniauxia sp. FL1348]|nr:MFS general substrate transporter [Biscogniauxia sp. FL1348]
MEISRESQVEKGNGKGPEVATTVTPSQEVPGTSSSRQIGSIQWAIVYAAMLSTNFLVAVDNTITADIQPAIIHTLGRVELLPWVGTGFALGGLTILTWSQCYGVFDTRAMYLGAITLFEAGSAVCGAAPDTDVLVIGRAVAGVGGCGIYAGILNYVSFLTTPRERPAYLVGSMAVWGLGSVLGPVIGGTFATSVATWRWVSPTYKLGFYINLAIGALFAPAYILLFPSIDPQPNKTLKQKCRMIDWPMIIVFLVGSACLIMAISFGGVVFAWDSGVEIALWVVSGDLLLVSIALARFHPGVAKRHRLYPAHYLKRPVLVNLQVQMFLSSGIILAMTYYIPLFFQFTRGYGPLEAGVRLLPLIISMVVVSIISGSLMPRFPLVSPWYIVGSALVLIGCALMYTVTENTPNPNIYGYMILIGAGAGCYTVAGVTIIQAMVPVEETSDSIGAMTIAQTLGIAIFLSASGTLYQNMAVRGLSAISDVLPSPSSTAITTAAFSMTTTRATNMAPMAMITDLVAGTSSEAYQALEPAVRAAVSSRLAAAMVDVWFLFLAAAALSFALSWFLIVRHIPPCFSYDTPFHNRSYLFPSSSITNLNLLATLFSPYFAFSE